MLPYWTPKYNFAHLAFESQVWRDVKEFPQTQARGQFGSAIHLWQIIFSEHDQKNNSHFTCPYLNVTLTILS